MAALKANSIEIKEADIGIKFEELTKKIFTTLGFEVDEDLRRSLNSTKDKADILLKISNNEIIIVECKTVKESGYNKFSSVSRQLKSYANRINGKDYTVVKSILVAPDFSDDFIKECGLEYELNLSLITASTLIQILEGFKTSKLKKFPHNLLMRDVLIQEDRVLKAIGR
jgi:Holliday junction resolvase